MSKWLVITYARVHHCAVRCASVAGGSIWCGSGCRCNSLGPATFSAFDGESQAGEAVVMLLLVLAQLMHGVAEVCTRSCPELP